MGLLDSIKSAVVGTLGLGSGGGGPVIKNTDRERGYQQMPSLADWMSLSDWNDEHNVGLLEDGVSLLRALEIKDLPCEAMSPEGIKNLYGKVQRLLSGLVPLEEVNPWHVVIYVQDDMTLQAVEKRRESYIDAALKRDPFTQNFCKVMSDHSTWKCQENGAFDDPMSGLPFRGRSRRIRIVFYRRHKVPVRGFKPARHALGEINEVTANLVESLKQLGLSVQIMTGQNLYTWIVRWVNPRPAITNGDVDALIKMFPYPNSNGGKAKKPFGWSIMQNAFKSTPVVPETKTGWLFDGIEHRSLIFGELESAPAIGVISRERELGGKRFALFDRFPEGSIYMVAMVFESKLALENHLTMIEKNAIGKGEEPKRVKADVAIARDEIEKNNLLIRTTQAILFRGDNEEDLTRKERDLRIMLGNSGLRVIETRYNLYPMDSYVRFMPGNYDHVFEKHRMCIARYMFASDLAAIIPFYGRSRGDQMNPLFEFSNRGGEAFFFDPYSESFKSNNSHMVLFGTSGAGKSVMISYMTLCMLAVMNARVVILEAGGSFDLLSQYVKHHGKKVEYLKFDRSKPIPVNPFIDAYKILTKLDLEARYLVTDLTGIERERAIIERHVDAITAEMSSVGQQATPEELKREEDRDILNEMTLVVRCMITGGIKKEEEAITRADMGLITQVIVNTVKRCYYADKPQVLTQDIIDGFELAAEENPKQADSYQKFAHSMREFVLGDLADFFNAPAIPSTDFDYLHIDLGFLKEKGKESGLNVVAISLLARVLGIAEANQYSKRPTIFIMDEAHLLFKNEMIAAFATLMAKVSRKIGLWLMPATQNIDDLNGEETKKLLSMMETWICLALSQNEIEKIEEFRTITDEEKVLLASVKKYPKVYAEAVLLGANFRGLFRNIPPRIALALAMTEQNEKATRQEIQLRMKCTELEAVEIVAEQLKGYRRTIKADEVFDD